MWLALAALLGHLAAMVLYGHHRDELYLWACGVHLDQGAIDHAPLVPLLARAQAVLLGDGAWSQRIVPALAAAGLVALTIHAARLLGADRRGQLIAGVAILGAPIFVWSGGVFLADGLEQVAWMAAGVAWLRAAAGRQRWWLVVGLAWGAGMLVTPTAALGVFATAFALVTSPVHRRAFRTAGPYAAAALVALFAAPLLAWQMVHDWPSLELLGEHAGAARARWSPAGILFEQPFLLGPLAAALVIAGALRSRRDARVRTLALAAFAALAGVLLLGGQSHDAAPAYPWLVAAGAAPAARFLESLSRRVRILMWSAGLAAVALAWTLALPILPRAVYAEAGFRERHREMVQFLDWPGLVAELAALHRAHADGGPIAILAGSYGTAAAIERHGPSFGLPPPISGANSYFVWGPPTGAPDRVLAIGYPPGLLVQLFVSVRPVGELKDRDGVDNRLDVPRQVFLCEGLLGPWREIWPRLRRSE